MIIPAFKSHYSLNKSILTLDESHAETGPRSIVKLVKDSKIENAFLIDDNMSGFLEAYYHSKNANIKLNFGLRLTFCADINDKSEASIKTESKYIVFLKKSSGYEALSKIFSTAASKGFYYIPRLDFKTLKELWTDALDIGIPFYDSFLFNNHMKMYNCFPPDFWSCPVFFWEENSMPFDSIYKRALTSHLSEAMAYSYSKSRMENEGLKPIDALKILSENLNNCDGIVGHNILGFDIYLIKCMYNKLGRPYPDILSKKMIFDTFAIAKGFFNNIPYQKDDNFMFYQYKVLNQIIKGSKNSLSKVASNFNIEYDESKLHDGLYDLELNVQIWNKLKYQVDI
jgi:hypothetical protein